jgi:hypothetical protein
LLSAIAMLARKRLAPAVAFVIFAFGGCGSVGVRDPARDGATSPPGDGMTPDRGDGSVNDGRPLPADGAGGSAPSAGAALQLRDEQLLTGFAGGDWQCAGAICMRGGIGP